MAEWEGGSPECEHRQGRPGSGRADGIVDERFQRNRDGAGAMGGDCAHCGARRIDQQLGLERTPEEYIATMVAVFREVRRVLRKDGTLWLNMGDSYAGSGQGFGDTKSENKSNGASRGVRIGSVEGDSGHTHYQKPPIGLKAKDLCGIPWMLAKALQAPYYTGRIKNELDRVWLAAMIDAEGCIFIHKRKAGTDSGSKFIRKDGTSVSYERTADTYGAGLEVANCSEAIVQRCLAITGIGSICTQGPNENWRRKQRIYRWNARIQECREIIREVYPYLVAKQQQARILLGCPSSGKEAEAAHAALIGLHNGVATDVDFPAPASMYEKGWYLRQDVIWSKANPMPESVTDRCTKSHEYIFLLSKSERYYYDAEAIADNAIHAGRSISLGDKSLSRGQANGAGISPSGNGNADAVIVAATRNKRSVWTVATQPFPEAHFATFPEELIKPCILAGCPAGGTVLDPFFGSGTTGLVARALHCKAIGIELKAEYLEIAAKRLSQEVFQFTEVPR